MFPQVIPVGTEPADDFARELAALLGTAYAPAPNTLVGAHLRVIGRVLANAHAALNGALAENFTTSATQLLGEWETRLGLPLSPGASVADRRAALTARRRESGGAITARVLAAVAAIDAVGPVAITTTTIATAAAASAPNLVFVFAVAIAAATYADPAKRARVVALLERIKPAHTLGNVGVAGPFRFDDPASLFDVTLFGG